MSQCIKGCYQFDIYDVRMSLLIAMFWPKDKQKFLQLESKEQLDCKMKDLKLVCFLIKHYFKLPVHVQHDSCFILNFKYNNVTKSTISKGEKRVSYSCN